jgi:predicted nucleic acid-binding protein
MNGIDTNVLLYVHDPRDPAKQEIAASLLQSLTDGVLLWQVACEYIAASRKLEPLGYSHVQAWQDISDLRRVWTTVLPGWGSGGGRTIIERLQPCFGTP